MGRSQSAGGGDTHECKNSFKANASACGICERTSADRLSLTEIRWGVGSLHPEESMTPDNTSSIKC